MSRAPAGEEEPTTPATVDWFERFCQHLPGLSSQASAAPRLRATMGTQLALAHAAHPGLAAYAVDFIARLAEIVAAEADATSALGSLHIADLLLAHRCAAGHPAAIAEFQRRWAPELDRYLRRVRAAESLRHEAKQLLMVRLFVGMNGGKPKLALFHGRGTLEGWLRVSAVRTALELIEQAEPESPSGRDELGELADRATPESAHLRAVFSQQFRTAFESAARGLSDTERLLVYQYHLDGLTIDTLGSLYGIHRVTAARRVAKARAKLQESTRRILERDLGLTSMDFDGLMGMAWSLLDVSAYRVLGAASSRSV